MFSFSLTATQHTARAFLCKSQQHQVLAKRFSKCYHGSKSEAENFLDNLGDLLEQNEKQNDKMIKILESKPTGTKPDDDNNGWRHIDWKALFNQRRKQQQQQQQQQQQTTVNAMTAPSPVERILIRNRLVHFKRDDQLKLSGGAPISGNKARKMVSLNDLSTEDFPSCVVSFGGPQSNAMLALAAICYFQNLQAVLSADAERSLSESTSTPLKRFVYYTKKLPRFLRNQPNGNLFRAQALGMELVEVNNDEYANMFGGEWGGPTEPPALPAPVPGDSVWVPQGGACGVALRGAWELASEIVDYWSNCGNGKPLSVCIPGGTCSTAVLVHAALLDILKDRASNKDEAKMDIRVVVIPCVGDEKYAQRQMLSLQQSTSDNLELELELDEEDIPTILPPIPMTGPRYFGQRQSVDDLNYFRFGEPSKCILATFRELQEEYGVTVDLLYGAPSWTILFRHFRIEPSDEDSSFSHQAPLAGREVMYVHSGGLEGINSQLMRYKYNGLLDSHEVQLPGRPS